MNKYLSFASATPKEIEPKQLAINGGLTCGVVSETNLALHSADSTVVYTLVGTGFTVKMSDAINEALILAAQTNWMKVEHEVMLPSGMAVTDITIG